MVMAPSQEEVEWQEEQNPRNHLGEKPSGKDSKEAHNVDENSSEKMEEKRKGWDRNVEMGTEGMPRCHWRKEREKK